MFFLHFALSILLFIVPVKAILFLEGEPFCKYLGICVRAFPQEFTQHFNPATITAYISVPTHTSSQSMFTLRVLPTSYPPTISSISTSSKNVAEASKSRMAVDPVSTECTASPHSTTSTISHPPNIISPSYDDNIAIHNAAKFYSIKNKSPELSFLIEDSLEFIDWVIGETFLDNIVNLFFRYILTPLFFMCAAVIQYAVAKHFSQKFFAFVYHASKSVKTFSIGLAKDSVIIALMTIVDIVIFSLLCVYQSTTAAKLRRYLLSLKMFYYSHVPLYSFSQLHFNVDLTKHLGVTDEKLSKPLYWMKIVKHEVKCASQYLTRVAPIDFRSVYALQNVYLFLQRSEKSKKISKDFNCVVYSDDDSNNESTSTDRVSNLNKDVSNLSLNVPIDSAPMPPNDFPVIYVSPQSSNSNSRISSISSVNSAGAPDAESQFKIENNNPLKDISPGSIPQYETNKHETPDYSGHWPTIQLDTLLNEKKSFSSLSFTQTPLPSMAPSTAFLNQRPLQRVHFTEPAPNLELCNLDLTQMYWYQLPISQIGIEVMNFKPSEKTFPEQVSFLMTFADLIGDNMLESHWINIYRMYHFLSTQIGLTEEMIEWCQYVCPSPVQQAECAISLDLTRKFVKNGSGGAADLEAYETVRTMNMDVMRIKDPKDTLETDKFHDAKYYMTIACNAIMKALNLSDLVCYRYKWRRCEHIFSQFQAGNLVGPSQRERIQVQSLVDSLMRIVESSQKEYRKAVEATQKFAETWYTFERSYNTYVQIIKPVYDVYQNRSFSSALEEESYWNDRMDYLIVSSRQHKEFCKLRSSESDTKTHSSPFRRKFKGSTSERRIRFMN